MTANTNRFATVDTIDSVIRQAVGAGSVCWVGGTGDAEFDSDRALAISEDACARIEQLIKGCSGDR